MPSPEALVATASGVALAGLSAFLLALQPRRAESTLFGAFVLLWAGQVVAANLARMTGGGAALHGPALLASFGLMAPATVLLAHLAAGQLGGRAGTLLRGAGLALGLAAGVVLALGPRLVVADAADAPGGGVVTSLGPLAFPLFLAPFHLAFVAACVAAYVRWRRAAPGAPQRRARALYCAFALFASYVAVRNLALVLSMPADLRLADGQQVASVATYAAASLAMLALLAHATLGPGPRLDRAMWASVAVPAGMAAAEAALAPGSVLGTGTWRLACVAVIAYALARHHLFDFELRIKQSGPAFLAAALVGAGLLGTLALRPAGSALALAPAGLGLASAGATLLLRDALRRALYPAARPTAAYVRSRQLDVYRVRLEQAIARPADTDADDLRRLRRALHISLPEHEAMEHVLRAHHGLAAEGDLVHGRYRLLRVLGEGGFGRVHLARDARTGGLVVVKLVHGGDAGREARIGARVDSPHVVRVLDAGDAPGGTFVALEYADGGTLADRLARARRLPAAEVERLAEGLLLALSAAHRAGVVHGDVKPENVLFTRDGMVKLGDFGGARTVDAARTRGVAGQATLQYASPEQLRGEAPTPRSDVYSAAAVLHRCLAGSPRAAWDDVDEDALRDAPPRLQAAVLRGLSRSPDARHEDAAEMLRALRGEVSVRVAA